jgi:uncharacterized protein (TIGR00251 family)
MSLPRRDSRTPDLPIWARWQSGALLIAVHAQPGARRTQVVGKHGDRLKIALHAPPVDGKANDELLRFIATTLTLRRTTLRLTAGLASREKTVAIDCDADAAAHLSGVLMAAAAD